jgi:hypothetical protein
VLHLGFFYGVPVIPFARYDQKIAMKSGEKYIKYDKLHTLVWHEATLSGSR